MESSVVLGEKEWLALCGSVKFAKEMASAGPFSSYQEAVGDANDTWFNKVDVNGWLEAFSAHPQIGESPSKTHKCPTSAQFSFLVLSVSCATRSHFISSEFLYDGIHRFNLSRDGMTIKSSGTITNYRHRWSKGEQSTALATATDSTLQELYEWNARYRQKFGFVFLIFASGRSTPEILAEMKRRYQNRPIVELELAAKEQMKITELRLSKLFSANATAASTTNIQHASDVAKVGEDRVSRISGHLGAAKETPAEKSAEMFIRTRPPITTHVLDIARGSPAAGIEVLLEMWDNNQSQPLFGQMDSSCNWKLQGSSTTDKDGRSGQLMKMVDILCPGIYRISFNTGKYNPAGFFPYVSIVFEIRDSQKLEHFHVPLLLSPFSFSTYRGS